jgi:hypothetical protein
MLRFPKENFIGIFNGFKIWKIKVCGQELKVIASNDYGWEHVSVSHKKRIPTWHEMCKIKDFFWDDDDEVIQFHPAKKDYISFHPRCLHLWRNLNQKVEMPPLELV